MTFNMGINHARGNANGADDYASNTDVRAGNTARLGSGGDTVLRGAVLAAGAVKADVGGDLRIASLQDTSSYDSKQSGGGFGVNLCLPPFCYGVSTASGSVSQSKAKGNFASVTEQSGIKAGGGGFQVAAHDAAASSAAGHPASDGDSRWHRVLPAGRILSGGRLHEWRSDRQCDTG
ncbi:hemagglutinin repeat-containing protein [Janthinobacterium fluminis]|uniref:hemagglutinin repeat-containing protein n=1 Tax=Janthinobacterium fluminis TaxID=2987524 RepID=UPI003B436675